MTICRRDFDSAKARFRDADAPGGATSAALSGALGEAQASVDACADRLAQPMQAVSLRRGQVGGGASTDELSVARCKAKVGAYVAMVDEACAKWRQKQQQGRVEGDKAAAAAARRPGERALMQARALRRALLGPDGVRRQQAARDRGGDDGNRFRQALEELDAVLAEADRAKADLASERSSETSRDSEAFFTRAAREAWRCAEQLQRVGEADVEGAFSRAEGARRLVRLALGEVGELEADVNTCGFDGERSVVEALRVARRGLEKISRALGEKAGAGANLTGEGGRVEAMVASGHLESALRGVDAARAELSRVRRVSTLEAKAREVLVEESVRVDALSRQAQELGLMCRPAVAESLQACRAAATTADRYDNQGGRGARASSHKREELARDYMAAALRAAEATGVADETLALERDAAARNDEERGLLEERLAREREAVLKLQSRLDRVATAAEERRSSLEGVRVLAASWKVGISGIRGPRGTLAAEPDGEAAARAVAEAREGLETLLRKTEASWDVGALGEDVEASLRLVAVAEAAVVEAEVRGRRRDGAFAVLERAAAQTQSIVADAARAAKVGRRPAVAEALAAAVGSVRIGLSAAMGTAAADSDGVEADDALLGEVAHAEDASERAVKVLARERLLMETAERERQERCSDLWAAARRLEELDTSGVVGDDPEAAAVVLEARSEAVQVRELLESRHACFVVRSGCGNWFSRLALAVPDTLPGSFCSVFFFSMLA